MGHIVCFQYKVSGYNVWFKPSEMNGDNIGWDEGDKIIYVAKCVCAWKLLKFNPTYIEALRKELKAIDALGSLIGFDDNMTKHRNSVNDRLMNIASIQNNQ